MRTYKASGTFHKVYDNREEFYVSHSEIPGPYISNNWKTAQIGDWVEADDGCIIQILRKGKLKTESKRKLKYREYVGTCTGTFMCTKNVKMDTSKRENIWTFSGKDTERVILERKNATKHEILFCQFMAAGLGPEQSYLKAFKTNNISYAKEQSLKLLKTERIRKTMKDELKPVCDELGIDEKYVLKGIKDEADTATKADVRLKALFKLGDIMDLEDKNQTKVTQIQGAIFKGFDGNALEQVERPQLGDGDGHKDS
jgi:hypothetical protein